MIRKKVAQYIDNEHLFSSKAHIIVALSGGADSVALLHILHWDIIAKPHTATSIYGRKNQTGMNGSFGIYVRQ